MYFTNIGNEELKHFHNTVGADFSISLTDLLDSNLFKVEEINSNIYRVFPLFYCTDIISSNMNDIILGNKCLILYKNEKETYLRFITHETENTILIPSNFQIFDINHDLTTEEFNAFVYSVRKQSQLGGDLSFEETNQITGVYADYEFNNIEGIRNDKGLIITETLKNNPITVTLKNPFFVNAKYTLTFTVKSLTGANVCDDDVDYKVIDTTSIVLIKDGEVILDLTDYVNDSVLLFDFHVGISFDVPEIKTAEFDLALTSNYDTIYYGESAVLTATITSTDSYKNNVIAFYKNGTFIENVIVGNDNTASLTVTPTEHGLTTYSVNILGKTAVTTVTANKKDTVLALTSNVNDITDESNQYTLSGTLKYNNTGLANKQVKLYDNNTFIEDLTTDNAGAFSKIVSNSSIEWHTLKVEYAGDDYYNSSSKSMVEKIRYVSEFRNVQITGDTITGYIYGKNNNQPIQTNSIWLTFYNENNKYRRWSVSSDANGYFTKTLNAVPTTWSEIELLQLIDYEAKSLDLTVHKNTQLIKIDGGTYGGQYWCHGRLLDGLGKPLANKTIKETFTGQTKIYTTDSGGVIYMSSTVRYFDVAFESDGYYNSSSAEWRA